MSEFLSAVMLICFGFSWPVNLVKNIKQRSARSMNLWFLLLIFTGYVAGILSRVTSSMYGYVFAIYIINILVVSANIVVYFINRGYDKRSNG